MVKFKLYTLLASSNAQDVFEEKSCGKSIKQK